MAERAAKEIVSLPMFPSLTNAQQARVAEEVNRFTLAPVLLHRDGTEQMLVSAK